jgi:hypothetical protein
LLGRTEDNKEETRTDWSMDILISVGFISDELNIICHYWGEFYLRAAQS